MPHTIAENGRQVFELEQVARWFADRLERESTGLDAGGERVRLLKAQADTAELRLDRERGLLVPVDDVERVWAMTFGTNRDLLRSIPQAVADGLIAAAAVGRPQVAAVLSAAIDNGPAVLPP